MGGEFAVILKAKLKDLTTRNSSLENDNAMPALTDALLIKNPLELHQGFLHFSAFSEISRIAP